MSSVGDYQNAAHTHTLSPNEIQPRGFKHLVKYYVVYSQYNQEVKMRKIYLFIILFICFMYRVFKTLICTTKNL